MKLSHLPIISQVLNLRLPPVTSFSTSPHIDHQTDPPVEDHHFIPDVAMVASVTCFLLRPVSAFVSTLPVTAGYLAPSASLQEHFSVLVLLWLLHPSPAQHWDPAGSSPLGLFAPLPEHLCMDSAWFRQRTCLPVWSARQSSLRSRQWPRCDPSWQNSSFKGWQPSRETPSKKPWKSKLTISHRLLSPPWFRVCLLLAGLDSWKLHDWSDASTAWQT